MGCEAGTAGTGFGIEYSERLHAGALAKDLGPPEYRGRTNGRIWKIASALLHSFSFNPICKREAIKLFEKLLNKR